jgi:TDG/mug DNA glycosylase family protein
LERYRDATVPDLIGPELRLLFVGINPGLWTAATQTHFCHPSNRFYPALRRAGMIDFEIDTGTGMTEAQRSRFTDRGMGISNLVRRATVRASELRSGELVEGGHRLTALVDELSPDVVAVAGVTAYRTAFADPSAKVGPLSHGGGPEWWILPNPSGLNAHVTIEGLADWFRQVGDAAGIV